MRAAQSGRRSEGGAVRGTQASAMRRGSVQLHAAQCRGSPADPQCCGAMALAKRRGRRAVNMDNNRCDTCEQGRTRNEDVAYPPPPPAPHALPSPQTAACKAPSRPRAADRAQGEGSRPQALGPLRRVRAPPRGQAGGSSSWGRW